MTSELHPIIAKLRSERIKRKFPQLQVATKADIHQNQLCRFEKGLHDPTLETVTKIADALGFNVVLRPKRSGGRKVVAEA